MINIKYILFLTLLSFGVFAQVPQAINYQGILRNSDGQSVPNKSITLRLTILSYKQNLDIGSLEYTEEIKTKTNEFGIYTLAIGKGIPIKGQFSSILWGKAQTKVQIDIDEDQSNNFEFAGTLELASVPYALYAESSKYAENSPPGNNGLNGATWLSGPKIPASSIGTFNDFYLNTTNGDYFKKTDASTWTFQSNLTGPVGLQGAQGIQGLTGAQGLQGVSGASGASGANGAQGIQGVAGTNGINGNMWLNGIIAPSTSLGNLNDFYLNTTNGDYFKKTDASTWTFQSNLTGPVGLQGAQGIQGLTGAQGLQGVSGASGANGAQGIQGVAGTNGINGNMWLNGIIAPSTSLGNLNDFYLNTTNGDYFKKTDASTWTFQSNLTGPVGLQGAQGIQGLTGAQGLQGVSGASGASGANGAQGIQGVAGTNGINGNMWLNGIIAPSTSLGNLNDFYLNTTNGDYFKKTDASTWTFQSNLTGPVGLQGAQGIQGLTGAIGASGTNGINGTNGTTWLNGTTVPATSIGVLNDFYINTSSGEYYKKTGSSTWTLQANLTGPSGIQNPTNSFIKSFKIEETLSQGQRPIWEVLVFSLEPNSSIEIDYNLTSIGTGGYHTCQLWVNTISDESVMGSFDEASGNGASSPGTVSNYGSVVITNISNNARSYQLILNKNSINSSSIKARIVCRKIS